MKNFALLVLILLTESAFAAKNYLPEHLEQLKQFNSCPHCELSEVNLDYGQYNGALLTGSNLMNASFYKANFELTDFTAASLIHAEADSAKFLQATFDDANLFYFDGSYSSFSGATFKKSNLTNATFYLANLSNADFTDAILEDTDLSYSLLIGAKITQDQLRQAKSLNCAVLPNGTVYARDNEKC